MKRYVPVQNFERHTSHCPTYIAWLVLDEARDYFRTAIPESYADQLAHRAEAVFARNEVWQRQYQSARGRDYLLASMRHWLASVLAKENPALFRQLPESFQVGQPLPPCLVPRPKKVRVTRLKHFVHGCELLGI